MTFQTVGSVFHNIVLLSKFSEVPPIFKRVLYILKKSIEKNHHHYPPVCQLKKHAYFLHEVQTIKGRNTEGVFLLERLHMCKQVMKKETPKVFSFLKCLHEVQEIKNVNAVKRFHF